MNNELERTWNEAAAASFKVLFQHLPGGTEINHEIRQNTCSSVFVA
jgi:hypothetical protein